ncbi:uroporphyrinogen decarboxylase family protein [Thermodesulfobacteriota bacterium]
MGIDQEGSYREREKRISDTIQLKIPDGVPVMLELSYFPAKYTGITCEAAYYDYDMWLKASCKTVEDFAPDMVQIAPFFPGKVYEILDSKQLKLPGHGTDRLHTHQFIEGEYLEADEYDHFMADHSDFLLRRYLPRMFGTLEPFNKLPAFFDIASSYREVPSLAEALAVPEIYNALEKFVKAGREMLKWRPKMKTFGEEIEKLGFPLYGIGGEHIPFDHLSYHVRGLRGIYFDMFRQPEKLIEVFDWLLPLQIDKAIRKAKTGNQKRVYFALHRGGDVFMSSHQFEIFYWPYAKKLINALIDEGYTPCVFLEGDYTSRLEYFLELPKGKVLCRFDSSDIYKAKDILHGHVCIMGAVPPSLLQLGSSQEVQEHCKKLIDVIGKDGGFIMAPASVPDDAKPENIKTMVEYTRKYGVYN